MPKTKGRVPHLFKNWNQISKRIQAAKHIYLFLDFDGTLVPICPTPDGVKMTAAMRRVLSRLNRHKRVHVTLISGRRNSTLRKYLRIPRVQLMGLYGWERKGRIELQAKTRKALPRLRSVLRLLPEKFPGVRIEEKGVSFAIHFRGAPPEATRRAQSWARKFLVQIRPDFRLMKGHSVYEIVPREVTGKGVALREVIRKIQDSYLPFYLGDDVTDEPAFQALRRGITIRVGPDFPTSANFSLRHTGEVRAFLERLEKELD